MKYFKWVLSDNKSVVVIRESRPGAYEPYFGKEIGFSWDMYDDYLPYFFDDMKDNPEKITEISEEEAFTLIKSEDG